MKKDNEDILKNLIVRSGIEAPSQRFTESVMNAVQPDTQAELSLKAVLQRSAIETPAPDFLLRIMSQVEVQPIATMPVSEIKPIISRRAWYWLGGVAAGIALLLGLFYQNSETSAPQTTATTIAEEIIFGGFIPKIEAISPVYSLCLIAISGLLMADYFLRNRFSRHIG